MPTVTQHVRGGAGIGTQTNALLVSRAGCWAGLLGTALRLGRPQSVTWGSAWAGRCSRENLPTWFGDSQAVGVKIAAECDAAWVAARLPRLRLK